MFSAFLKTVLCRDSTTLYTSMQGQGDCFETDCSFNRAMLTIRMADIIKIQDKLVLPTTYPSEFSDLIESTMCNNGTLVTADGGTVIDGKMLTGGTMYYLENQKQFTWGKLKGFTFRNFNKLIMSRQHSWSTYPQAVFEDCVFEDNTYDLFSASGGHWVFINCVFRNNTGRIFKALSETTVEFIDCQIEESQAAFAYGADMIFRNCVFTKCFGQRGGAVHASKSTLYVNKCKFINCNASANGGAVYIRDSHERYQSEISESCFFDNRAGMNGTAIYSYLSDLEVSRNVFSAGEEEFFQFSSEIHGSDNTYKGDVQACIRNHRALNEPDQFFPCDTYQRHEFDDAMGSIVMDFSNDEEPQEELLS